VDYDILFSEVDDMNSARQIEYGKSLSLYDEVIWDMKTLVGQIYFDFFLVPLIQKGQTCNPTLFGTQNTFRCRCDEQ
jgi:hypothetical protein